MKQLQGANPPPLLPEGILDEVQGYKRELIPCVMIENAQCLILMTKLCTLV